MKNDSLLKIALGCMGLFFLGLLLDWSSVCFIVKPIPVLLLAIAVWQKATDFFESRMAIGLFFCSLGDFILELGPGAFVFGLGSFLLAHLFYSWAFWTENSEISVRRAVPFFIWGIGFDIFLRSHLGPMLIPVILYTIVICTMMWRAVSVVSSRTQGWSLLLVLGAVSFAASDSIIAIHRFYYPFEGSKWPIMILYWLGQILMVRSVFRRAHLRA